MTISLEICLAGSAAEANSITPFDDLRTLGSLGSVVIQLVVSDCVEESLVECSQLFIIHWNAVDIERLVFVSTALEARSNFVVVTEKLNHFLAPRANSH
ncbi:hypothetical protein [Methylocystis parvus]|uniref:hypothetical protein n=1 Tax=Methylocystis parvus TaxID=134 RepID=UPI003C7408D9